MANNVNARFREWINGGWVTLTLIPGREINWGRYERTDEGYNLTGYSWLLEQGNIHRSIVSDGSDCDGRLTHYHESEARIEDIDRNKRVQWHDFESSQRDYAAEAAGY